VSEAKPGLRIDKWLWQARFFKTRSLATKLVQSGKLRLNGDLISKPARMISVGDVLTFPKALDTRVIEVRALGTHLIGQGLVVLIVKIDCAGLCPTILIHFVLFRQIIRSATNLALTPENRATAVSH